MRFRCEGFSPQERVKFQGVLKAARNVLPLGWLRWLNVAAVSDADMASLNSRFRQKKSTTDVLSFIYPDDHGAEIYISPQVARRQARERGITLRQEYGRLLIHGLGHVAGLDHPHATAFAMMRQKECEILVQCDLR